MEKTFWMKKAYWEELCERCKGLDHVKFISHKYRCEQTIINKVDEEPVCAIRMKSDYLLESFENIDKGMVNARCTLLEQFANIYPSSYEKPLELMNDLEKLKCEAVLGIDMGTGIIETVINEDEMREKWEEYKTDLLNKYDFLKSKPARDSMMQFVQSVEKVMTNGDLLLAELKSKMFFTLLFGGYIVGKEEYNNPYDIELPSQLFQGITVPMRVTPRIIKESPSSVLFERKGEIDEETKRKKEIREAYDTRFKPSVDYSFSEYAARLYVHALVNGEQRYVQEAECNITEEVLNNVSMTIQYKIRKLDE